ncbi:MAG: DJ-1/PfpI family protein [Woeseiaceae bacterium]|nr:DJ-1/PfpI family protein [Woeseiaceae bacterium]
MRTLIASLLLAAIALPAGIAKADDKAAVFMFVRDGSRDLELMLSREVGVMRQMLEDAGYTVDIATASGEPMVAESVTLTPTVRLEDVEIAAYAGVVLPCMAPAPGMPVPADVDRIMVEAVTTGLPIAASRGSVATLAKAGGVADRQYAYASPVDVAKRPDFAGGDFQGTGVIRDGNISTAGICPLAARELGEPDGTVELMQQFIASLTERG